MNASSYCKTTFNVSRNLHLTNYKAFIKLVFINYRSVLQTNVIMESYVNLEILNGTAYISISKQCIYVKARCY